MTSQTREVAQKMIEGGWRVVPIKPREKAPDGGNGWQEKTFTPECFQEKNGIGIMTGHGVLALDIDSYDPEVSKAISDEAKRRFGKTLERVGQSPKTALFYRGLHPRRRPTIASATVMRVTAIQAKNEGKRQDRSARYTEKQRRRDRTQRFRGLIRPVSAACATAGAAKGKKRLSRGRIQAIFTSVGTPLGECRVRQALPLVGSKCNERKRSVSSFEN